MYQGILRMLLVALSSLYDLSVLMIQHWLNYNSLINTIVSNRDLISITLLVTEIKSLLPALISKLSNI